MQVTEEPPARRHRIAARAVRAFRLQLASMKSQIQRHSMVFIYTASRNSHFILIHLCSRISRSPASVYWPRPPALCAVCRPGKMPEWETPGFDGHRHRLSRLVRNLAAHCTFGAAARPWRQRRNKGAANTTTPRLSGLFCWPRCSQLRGVADPLHSMEAASSYFTTSCTFDSFPSCRLTRQCAS